MPENESQIARILASERFKKREITRGKKKTGKPFCSFVEETRPGDEFGSVSVDLKSNFTRQNITPIDISWQIGK
jgi:hypothetical protein